MKRYRLYCADGREVRKEGYTARELTEELEDILADDSGFFVDCSPHRVETVEE